MAQNGATDEEIEILLTERVELNAMASDDLIEMVERKLNEVGIKKVIPDDDLLEKTFHSFHYSEELREVFEKAEEEFKATATEIAAPRTYASRSKRSSMRTGISDGMMPSESSSEKTSTMSGRKSRR